jgi:hypothetical protein
MQFLGTIDAATQNGSEQIFLPMTSGWRPTTKVGVFDPDHPQRSAPTGDPKTMPAILAWGPGFGESDRGNVMMEASHNIAKATAPANVAAQRAFFNFSFLTSTEEAVLPTISSIPDPVSAGTPVPLTFTVPPGTNLANYTIQWSASCGGTFSPNATQQNVTWYPPAVTVPTVCLISVEITDQCGRKTFDTKSTTVVCDPAVTTTVTSPSCFGNSNGSILMNITNGNPPYNWTWSRTNPDGGPVSGTGATIPNLSAGTYSVTLTVASGCSTTFSTQVTQPAVLSATATVTNIGCFGGTGSISINVTGGTAPYTFDWADLPGPNEPQNRTGLAPGTYNVTVTDSKGCTTNASGTITQPTGALNVTGVQTNVSCNGFSDGAITLTITGGTSPMTFDWTDLTPPPVEPQDRTGLTPGAYSVTVTDANGCAGSLTKTITQPAVLSLSVAVTNPTCETAPFDGAINLTVTGGTTPYNYSWNDLTGSPDPEDRTAIGPGSYTVIVTDAKSCTATITATLVATTGSPNPPAQINH